MGWAHKVSITCPGYKASFSIIQSTFPPSYQPLLPPTSTSLHLMFFPSAIFLAPLSIALPIFQYFLLSAIYSIHLPSFTYLAPLTRQNIYPAKLHDSTHITSVCRLFHSAAKPSSIVPFSLTYQLSHPLPTPSNSQNLSHHYHSVHLPDLSSMNQALYFTTPSPSDIFLCPCTIPQTLPSIHQPPHPLANFSIYLLSLSFPPNSQLSLMYPFPNSPSFYQISASLYFSIIPIDLSTHIPTLPSSGPCPPPSTHTTPSLKHQYVLLSTIPSIHPFSHPSIDRSASSYC